MLEGSENPEGMKKFIDFMLEQDFQAALPDNMYVYPVDTGGARCPTPGRRTRRPRRSRSPIDPAEIDANRADWLRDWRDITSR